jgi:hypothetical protein
MTFQRLRKDSGVVYIDFYKSAVSYYSFDLPLGVWWTISEAHHRYREELLAAMGVYGELVMVVWMDRPLAEE